MRNLRTRTPQARILTIVNGVWMVNAGGNFEASLLLDEEIWNNHRFRMAGGPVAAVPERDILLAGTDTHPPASGTWPPWQPTSTARNPIQSRRIS